MVEIEARLAENQPYLSAIVSDRYDCWCGKYTTKDVTTIHHLFNWSRFSNNCNARIEPVIRFTLACKDTWGQSCCSSHKHNRSSHEARIFFNRVSRHTFVCFTTDCSIGSIRKSAIMSISEEQVRLAEVKPSQ
jgi:hypothetical protein